MTMSATLVAAAGLCIGLIAAPAAAADRDARLAPAQGNPASAAAFAGPAGHAAPNCLLPGQIRNFGGITMVTPRRMVTLDAADCAVRGGEPIAAAASN